MPQRYSTDTLYHDYCSCDIAQTHDVAVPRLLSEQYVTETQCGLIMIIVVAISHRHTMWPYHDYCHSDIAHPLHVA